MIIHDKKGAALLEKSLKFGYCLMVEHGELRLMGEDSCRYTGLQYGRPLYQLEDLRILSAAVRPELLNCSATNAMACGGSSLAWMDDDSTIYFRAYRPGDDSEQKVLWDALESVRWTTFGV